jgi:hypothetical protein
MKLHSSRISNILPKLPALFAMALLSLSIQVPIAASDSAGASCNRTCLRGMLDQYLTALAKHDPSTLPVTAAVKFTENGEPLKLGEGFWKTAGPIGAYKLYVLDPESGAAALQALVQEKDTVAQVLLRLKIDNKKISEVETFVVRKGDHRFFEPDKLLTLSPVFNEAVPVVKRHTRQELIAAADSYFTAIHTESTPDYKPAPFADGMNRYENGVQTTNVSFNGRPPSTAGEQLDRGAFKGVRVMDRRYPVVDVENGTVLGIVTFRGDSPPRTTTLLLSEVFKVTDGKLQEIRAVMLNRPLDIKTGWN